MLECGFHFEETMALDAPSIKRNDPEPVAATLTAAHEQGRFARGVAGMFTTRLALFAMSLVTGILAGRILGTTGSGTYAAIISLPALVSAFGMFGLPSAVNYFAGKGMSLGSLMMATFRLTALLSIVLVVPVWLALPTIERSILRAAGDSDPLLRLVLLALPFVILSTFGSSILFGRQAVRLYGLIQITMAAATLTWVIVVVGALNQGVRGFVVGTVLITVVTSILMLAAVHRLGRENTGGSSVSFRGLGSYATRTYPASLSGYFSYRADTYVLQAVVANPKSPLGLYNRAVSMDELIFYIPDSISSLFLPRVAGAPPEESQAMVARVGRLTTLLTICAAMGMIPVAYAGIYVLLPAFVDCLPAFLVLLPGVVSLSIGKVMTSYLGGRGRPGLVALGTTASLALNLLLNLLLIPRLGIVGASLSSTVSYTFQAAVAIFLASRLSGHSPLSLFVPGLGEVRLLAATLPRLLRGVPLIRRWSPEARKGH
jgi:O-antigen/teichoic acid export membrane protein